MPRGPHASPNEPAAVKAIPNSLHRVIAKRASGTIKSKVPRPPSERDVVRPWRFIPTGPAQSRRPVKQASTGDRLPLRVLGRRGRNPETYDGELVHASSDFAPSNSIIDVESTSTATAENSYDFTLDSVQGGSASEIPEEVAVGEWKDSKDEDGDDGPVMDRRQLLKQAHEFKTFMETAEEDPLFEMPYGDSFLYLKTETGCTYDLKIAPTRNRPNDYFH